MAISPKQRHFIREYVVDMNATRAAIAAGYSEKTARAQGSALLTKVDIQQAVAKTKERQFKRVEINGDEVLATIKRLMDEAADDGDRANALKAAELLGRHKSLFSDRLTVTGDGVSFQLNLGGTK